MLIITALWEAKPGKAQDLKTQLEAMVEQVREFEPDCFEYILHQSRADENQFFLYEQYKDQAAVNFHKKTPHFINLMAETKSLLVDDVEIQLFDLIM